MTATELVALLGSDEVGHVRRDKNGKLSFSYVESWRSSAEARPLSLSMPLTQAVHGDRVVSAYLWGLLPDNELILQRWASKFHVSAAHPFSLIAKVGEDCAGAVRFVEAGRRQRDPPGEIDWLDERGVAERLRALSHDVSAWRAAADLGQFSLAGAQPKTALLFDGARWGVPSGPIPTTHILKPGVSGLAGHAENEHFCLALARELGLPAARTEVRQFEDQVAIVVERYDRARGGAEIVRIHQEDVCQALGLPPSKKYENEGGPGARAIVSLLREHSSRREEDLQTFVDALVFSWLSGATDAHAKNYSILIGSRGKARLAPLYDVASALPYDELPVRKLKLAMKVGGKYRLHEIGVHEWTKLFADLRITPEQGLSRVRRMADALPDLTRTLATRCRRAGLSHPVLTVLADRLHERARSVRAAL